MQAWKKWLLFGVAAGTTIVVLGSLVIGVSLWYSNREQPWDSRSVGVVSVDDAYQYADETFEPSGFRIDFAVRSDLSRDTTLSDAARIMKRYKKDSALEHVTHAKLVETFVPAGQTAKASLSIEWSCVLVEADGTRKNRKATDCYNELIDGVDAFVVFDQRNRLQVTVRTPKLGRHFD